MSECFALDSGICHGKFIIFVLFIVCAHVIQERNKIIGFLINNCFARQNWPKPSVQTAEEGSRESHPPSTDLPPTITQTMNKN